MVSHCSVCNNGDGPCGYSSRRARSFSIRLSHGFEDHVTVPCHFKERLNSFTTDFLIIRPEPGLYFDLYIRRNENCTLLGGAYWRDFVNVMNLSEGDLVRFNAFAFGCLFDVQVFDKHDNIKAMSQAPAVHQAVEGKRFILHETIFEDMYALTNNEVSKILKYLNSRNLAEDDYSQRYIVHRMTDADIAARRLVIPADVTFWLEIPRDGDVMFYNKYVGQSHGKFTSGTGMDTMITHGWTRLRKLLGIISGSTIVLNIKMMPDVLRVEVEVISI